jgi:hypothetical protein
MHEKDTMKIKGHMSGLDARDLEQAILKRVPPSWNTTILTAEMRDTEAITAVVIFSRKIHRDSQLYLKGFIEGFFAARGGHVVVKI